MLQNSDATLNRKSQSDFPIKEKTWFEGLRQSCGVCSPQQPRLPRKQKTIAKKALLKQMLAYLGKKNKKSIAIF